MSIVVLCGRSTVRKAIYQTHWRAETNDRRAVANYREKKAAFCMTICDRERQGGRLINNRAERIHNRAARIQRPRPTNRRSTITWLAIINPSGPPPRKSERENARRVIRRHAKRLNLTATKRRDKIAYALNYTQKLPINMAQRVNARSS